MVSSTLPSSVHWRTRMVAVVGQPDRVVGAHVHAVRRVGKTPSPQERRKLPARSNTIIGCSPRLKT